MAQKGWPGCPRQDINHSLEKLKVIYIKLFFLLDARVNYQFKTSAEKFREVGGANSSSLKVLLEWTANVHFCTICEITDRWSLKVKCGL